MDKRDLRSWQLEDLLVLARGAGILWASTNGADPLDVLHPRQIELLDRAADSYLLAAGPDDDEDDEGSQDGDGFIVLDRYRYFVSPGREDGFQPADAYAREHGYPDPDVAAYELAALMAEHGENPDSWMCGEHGPSERDAGALVDSFLDFTSPDIRLKPLAGVRYAAGTEVRYDDATWEVIRDYGVLGVWLGVPRDWSAGEVFASHSRIDRADDLSKARSWIAECQLIRGDVADLPDAKVRSTVACLFAGGWERFAREADLLRAARAWALENTWRENDEDPEYIAGLPDDQIQAGIEEHYEGGWKQFVLDGGGS
jgi:hypothetical protein